MYKVYKYSNENISIMYLGSIEDIKHTFTDKMSNINLYTLELSQHGSTYITMSLYLVIIIDLDKKEKVYQDSSLRVITANIKFVNYVLSDVKRMLTIENILHV